jgi:peptidyl-prolyl cis-trans isomerase A (cyclophilin A)
MRNLLILVLAACTGTTESEPVAPKPAPAAPAEAPVAKAPPAAPEVWKVPEGANPALTNPSLATEQAPAEYKVRFETTKGPIVVLVHRDWAPNGADRFYNLVKVGFYDQAKFFRAIKDFMVQFGISPYPEAAAAWKDATIKDDPVKESNKRGRVTFATAGPNTRTTQLFINLKDNGNLDGMGFAPFGEVVEGMEVVDQLFMGYGEGAPSGRGPAQGRIQAQGNAYLEDKFPKLDGIVGATLVQ